MKNLLITGATLLLSLLQISHTAWAQPAANGSTDYVIDGANSILRIYVGRAGVLSRLGHNHVIHTRELSGRITLAEPVARSVASLSIAVASFIVDATAERQRAGEGYESQPDENAINGTRNNMLSDAVLDAENYPTITMDITPVSVTDSQWLMDIALNLRGNSWALEVPAQVQVNEGTMEVQATFTLDHEALGLEPFSALGGSLRVAEALDFELLLRATEQP